MVDHAHKLKCPDCGDRVFLRRRNPGDMQEKVKHEQPSEYVYLCEHWPQCRGLIHTKSDLTPRGDQADSTTRELRFQLHQMMDPLWIDAVNGLKRYQVYDWLAMKLGLAVHQCHIQKMTADQCREAMAAIAETKPKSIKKWSDRQQRKARREATRGKSHTTLSAKVLQRHGRMYAR